MSLEHLWAGWRAAYVGSVADAECVFCGILSSTERDENRFVIDQGPAAAVLLNAYPYTTGHLMVMPVRHVRELEDLNETESMAVWLAVRMAVTALKRAYEAEGVNIGINLGRAAGAGIPGHLHVHAVPRWLGDTNFMTTVASVRVMPESLADSWHRLRAVWQ